MIIGNFTYSKAQDTYTGELATLTVAARKVVFQPSEARGDKAPSPSRREPRQDRLC